MPATIARYIPLNRSTVTALEIAELHTKEKYKDTEPYEGALHPFDGWLEKTGINLPLAYFMWGISKMPSWLPMILISFLTRNMMSVFHRCHAKLYALLTLDIGQGACNHSKDRRPELLNRLSEMGSVQLRSIQHEYGDYDVYLSFSKFIVCHPFREYLYFHMILSDRVRMKAWMWTFICRTNKNMRKNKSIFPECSLYSVSLVRARALV
jgi:hypothetical protein